MPLPDNVLALFVSRPAADATLAVSPHLTLLDPDARFHPPIRFLRWPVHRRYALQEPSARLVSLPKPFPARSSQV
jgi:hypothetical protein